jgi:hypothetical protein
MHQHFENLFSESINKRDAKIVFLFLQTKPQPEHHFLIYPAMN